jgi:hypothetical protein
MSNLPLKLNPHPVSSETSERQGGGQHPTTGEVHGQKKAERIPAEKRYSGAGSATLKNSPGRASSDTQDKE